MNKKKLKKCQIHAILIMGIFSIGTFSSYAQTQEIISVTTSKKSYNEGDTIIISGQVSSTDSDIPVTLQIVHGGSLTDIVQIKLSKSGKFTHSVLTQGPLWQEDGTYTVRVSYGSELMKETKFEFLTKTPLLELTQSTTPEPQQKTTPDFIDPSKGAQYYFDRYYNEPAYKTWFDTNYPNYTIEEAVHLAIPNVLSEPTKRVPNFIDPEIGSQYYLDRYYNEPEYKIWFDTNYAGYTIEETIELAIPGSFPNLADYDEQNVDLKPQLPEWIRNIFIWYGEKKISEDELLEAIQFLLDNGILQK